METKRSRRGCTACRVRHLKCDETTPVCNRCVEANRDCEQVLLCSQWQKQKQKKIRKTPVSNAPMAEQTWMQIPSKLTFVIDNLAEDAFLQSQSAQQQQDKQQPQQQQQQQQQQEEQQEKQQQQQQQQQQQDEEAQQEHQYNDFSIVVNCDPSPQSSADDSTSLSQFSSSVAFSSAALDWPSATTSFLDPSSLECLTSFSDTVHVAESTNDPGGANTYEIIASSPRVKNHQGHINPSPEDSRLIKGRTEAQLLRHYCQKLAPWFDVTDANRYFQLEVSKRASKCEVLLNAVFALSAQHLSRTSQLEASIAEVYHSRCNSLLIPLLNDEHSLTDENLLATVVILRKYEEMNVGITGQDLERHFVGVAALFSSPICALNDGLGQAAFWQFVRQDVYMSLPKRAPPRTDTSMQPPLIQGTIIPDCQWANRMVWITVCALDYCFGEHSHDPTVWQELDQQIELWKRDRPSTFDAIYSREPSLDDGLVFPEIWLSDPWHATGVQYYHISKMLLAIYNPNVARASAGLDYPRAHRQMQRSVLHHGRAICGIASSNDFVTTRFMLCAVMLACGGWFTDPKEQVAIISLLAAAEKDNGWPTKSVVESLNEIWSINSDV